MNFKNTGNTIFQLKLPYSSLHHPIWYRLGEDHGVDGPWLHTLKEKTITVSWVTLKQKLCERSIWTLLKLPLFAACAIAVPIQYSYAQAAQLACSVQCSVPFGTAMLLCDCTKQFLQHRSTGCAWAPLVMNHEALSKKERRNTSD